MFHSSSKHNFDTMFVILCVIAGATTHNISNSSKSTPTYKSHSRHKSSFIELLLENGSTEEIKTLGQPTNEIDDQPFWKHSYRAGVHELLRNRKEPFTICAQLSNILSGSQMRFCQKHYEILASVLPQVMHLTRRECLRITRDFRWNCSALNMFLDRSNSLSFTKEAAFIRSLINASMMYLTVKTCFDNQFSTCGCYNSHAAAPALASPNEVPTHSREDAQLDADQIPAIPISNVTLSELDLEKLETGSPLRLTRSMVRRQVCKINIQFADTFTRVFMDAEDIRSLNKAHKILNEDSSENHSTHKSAYERRLADADYRDLSFIRWTKSAVNIHNNNIGRQVVRYATYRQCRCHGVSGMCQYQTCWDRLNDIETVSAKLKEIYMTQSDLSKPLNLGTFSNPDLYLVKSKIRQAAGQWGEINTGEDTLTRIGSNDLAYLYQSPDYCEAHPSDWYFGTVGRECHSTSDQPKSVNKPRSGVTHQAKILTDDQHITPGSCEYLCCDRGFRSELILDFIDCNCRFKFCCRIECDRCLRQRMRHYCR